ncbi:MAG TPA: DUF1232 domain-containing protein [Polyangiaceae bacterium]|jgi:uncharacterized membrane protein YkvA (DUF1232 family)|nr:DUF1232 domain-containing protein [Polyangiaceae bacterium]
MNSAAPASRYLEIFPQWLRSLGEDALAVGDVIAHATSSDESTRESGRCLISGINYIFKSLDLIPDGVDDLGFLDDAFVLRVACGFAVAADPALKQGVVERLAEDAHAVRDFLSEIYPGLESYVADLRKGAARGRSVDDIVNDPDAQRAFLEDVRSWAAAYRPPSFTRDPKTLVKLKAFLSAKLA